MGLFALFSLSTLETVLTFQFLIPSTIIAAAMLFGLDFLAKQEAAEKEISHAVAEKGMDVTLSELSLYNGTTSGKPILLSILGKVYDVGAGKALYGVGGQYHQFAGKDISVACAKFSKTNAALFNTKWLNLSKEERALLSKWETLIAAKYPEVGKVSDPENYSEIPAAEGDAEVLATSDKFSTTLGLGMFEKGHIAIPKQQ